MNSIDFSKFENVESIKTAEPIRPPFILINFESLKGEELKVRSTISCHENSIFSSENSSSNTWIFGVESKPER